MRPVSSAHRHELVGLDDAALGWCQRSSASTPYRAACRGRTGAGSADGTRRCSSARPQIHLQPLPAPDRRPHRAANSASRPRPRALARYSAMSASRSSSPRCRRRPGGAMPTLRRSHRRPAVEDERLVQHRQHPLRQHVSVGPARATRPRRATTNSSPPRRRERVARAHPCCERGAIAPQQLVAGRVAEGVVDLLEVVEVDEHRRRPGPGPAGTGPASARPVLDQRAGWRAR